MKTFALLLLAGLLGSGLALAQENPLETAKAEYARRREAFQTARDETVGKALATYRAELGTLLANVRQQGNLDYVLAIENEVKRLEAGGGAPLEPAAPAFAHLRRIQWAARQAEDKADKDLTEQTAKLRAAYTAELERLEKTLVANNRIEEAKAVREEKGAVEAREAICGKWLWSGKHARMVTEDGKILESRDGSIVQIGTWEFLGQNQDGTRRYRTVIGPQRYVDLITLSGDKSRMEWTAGNKHYFSVRPK